MNNWYIDRSKNFVNDTLTQALECIQVNQGKNTVEIETALSQSGALGEAGRNPKAAMTRLRDHGLMRMDNTLGDSTLDYLEGKIIVSELVVDLFIKRSAEKSRTTAVRPFILICQFFENLCTLNTRAEELFLTFSECKEYLCNCDSYDENSIKLAKRILSERTYINSVTLIQPRVSLSGNEKTNYSIWFNALKQVPIFMPEGTDDRSVLRPNLNQRAFLNYISNNAKELSYKTITNNIDLYKYYCDSSFGINELLPSVIKSSVDFETPEDIELLIHYLFGYKMYEEFDYNKYVNFSCFGIYYPFIAVPGLVIRKIKSKNEQLAKRMFEYIDQNRNEIENWDYQDFDYTCIINLNFGPVEITAEDKNQKQSFKKWMAEQIKNNGERRFRDNTIEAYINALSKVPEIFGTKPIFSITDHAEFKIVNSFIRKHKDYARFNRSSGNGGLSAGLLAYGEFISGINMSINIVADSTDDYESQNMDNKSNNGVSYAWFVGACGHDENGNWTDFSNQYISESRWENRYDDKFHDDVKRMRPGDRIVIKAAYTKKNDLPFNNYGKTVGVMAIKAVGTVLENIGDGKNIRVSWKRVTPTKEWYGDGVLRTTVHFVDSTAGYIKSALLRFVFEDMEQDYDLCSEQYRDDNDGEQAQNAQSTETVMESPEPYTKEDFLNKVFISDETYEELKNLILYKKNIILQGAPGVGKTFLAKRFAYSLMGYKYKSHVEMIQFHQNYSYEDFIMGYKPTQTGFDLQEGVFYRFCEKARKDISNDYFFIIDEINRGNLSKIFGELMMLVEGDKRGETIKLAYRDEEFGIPKNVYIIGMMNTADRSLAMLDYALRRRFSFFDVEPAFESPKFKAYLESFINSHEVVDKVITRISELNRKIADEETSGLGKGFCVGHSYFCVPPVVGQSPEEWYKSIITYEIAPLLDEYWWDDKTKAEDCKKELFKE